MSEETPAFTGTTHVGVVLDKSGSMGAVRKETIDGFNVWLDTMRKEPGDIRLSITLFDTSFSTPVQEALVAKVNPLDESRYQPAGSTALLDATADSIRALSAAEAANGNDRYLVCIVTDGQENASKRTTKEDLATLIRQKEASGRWTFTYLSAGMDAFGDASAIGVQAGNTMRYTADSAGTKAAFRASANAARSFSASGSSCSGSIYGGARHVDDFPATPFASPIPTGQSPWTSDAAAPALVSGSAWVQD